MKVYTSHKNILSMGKFLGIPIPNWIEAFIVTGLLYFIIHKIPFVEMMKGILFITCCVPVFIFFCLGIKGRSVFRMLLNIKKFYSSQRVYHLRSVYDESTKNKSEFLKTEDNNPLAKKITQKAARKIANKLKG